LRHTPYDKEKRIAENKAANDVYIKKEFPDEKFIKNISELQSVNKYTKDLVIPEDVKIAESRMPRSAEQRRTLIKELRQASMLTEEGNSVYLIPERGAYGEKSKDAIVNGTLFEFREITGKARTLEWEFGDAKEKGNETNVLISIESNISKHEVRRRIGMVLERHPEYTGKIIVTFNEGKIKYYWDTNDLRKKTPALRQGRLGAAELNHNRSCL